VETWGWVGLGFYRWFGTSLSASRQVLVQFWIEDETGYPDHRGGTFEALEVRGHTLDVVYVIIGARQRVVDFIYGDAGGDGFFFNEASDVSFQKLVDSRIRESWVN